VSGGFVTMKKEPIVLMFILQLLDKMTPDWTGPFLHAPICFVVMLFYDDVDDVIKKEKDRLKRKYM